MNRSTAILPLVTLLVYAAITGADAQQGGSTAQQSNYANMLKMHDRWKGECARLVKLYQDTKRGAAGNAAQWDRGSSLNLKFACETYEKYGHDMWTAGRLQTAPTNTVPAGLPFL
ncbi:MAG: hypothetical protein HKN85_08490 [Gammaproteobacteria bacterium]|nr:hypothetical protein [Gammaproteobacteria bacterium]